jgi:hypothetical protein
VEFGFRRFADYRIRALLYAGTPGTYLPPSHPANPKSHMTAVMGGLVLH